MPDARPRILLVDNDQDLAVLMEEFFRTQGFLLSAVPNGPEGLHEALSGGYDLVLLDVMIPGLDGFELLRRLRAQTQLPVLMLTANAESSNPVLGLLSGADDYLPKPFDPVELAARVRAILRRTGMLSSNGALALGGIRIDPSAREVFCQGQPISITSIEFDILETLMRSAGRAVSRDEVMQRLYQRSATPFDRAVDVHISHLRKKLQTPFAAILTVRGVGYQFTVTGDGSRR